MAEMNIIQLLVLTASIHLICCKQQYANYKGYQLININNADSNIEMSSMLKKLEELKADVWKVKDNEIHSMVSGTNSSELKKYLVESGVKFDVNIDDIKRVIEENKKIRFKRDIPGNGIVLSMYNRYETIVSYLKSLDQQHDHVSVFSIGSTYQKRDIYAVKISEPNSVGKSDAIFLEFGIHAREWISTATGLYLIQKLATLFGKEKLETDLVRKYDWYIIPIANPDGYATSWTYDRMWRKNMVPTSTPKCIGVDLNRNFNVHFTGLNDASDECQEQYRGTNPFSEQETKAIQKLALQLKGRTKAYFSIHSYGQIIAYPFGFSKDRPNNDKDLHNFGETMATEIRSVNGTVYDVGSISKSIYFVSGDSVDWFYNKMGVKLSFAIELKDKGKYGFLLPPSKIIPTASEFYKGLSKALVQL